MPKRKRSYSKRRKSYRRSNPSVNSVIRALAKAQQQVGPFGVPGSATMTRYGPSDRQMRKNPGLHREGGQNMNRILDRYYGDGDYRKWGSRLGGAAAGATLAALGGGGVVGALQGAASGYNTGKKFSEMRGWGDYETGAIGNQIMSNNPSSASTPVFMNPSDDLSGDIIFSHREFVGNVTAPAGAGSTSDFNLREYELNPGLDSTFPYLSQIAKNFEMYEFQGLAFQYVPTTGESSSVGQNNLGKVLLSTQYDPSSTAFRSSREMQSTSYSTSAKPSLGQTCGIETDTTKRATDLLYIREGKTDRDPVFTDIGKFVIATEGIPHPSTTSANTPVQIGELWVTYRVKLTRHKLCDAYGSDPVDVFRLVTVDNRYGGVGGDVDKLPSGVWAHPKNDGLVTGIRDHFYQGTDLGIRIYLKRLKIGHVIRVTWRVYQSDTSAEVDIKLLLPSDGIHPALELIPQATTSTNSDYISAGSEAPFIAGDPSTSTGNLEQNAVLIAYFKVVDEVPSWATLTNYTPPNILVANLTSHLLVERASEDIGKFEMLKHVNFTPV